MSIYKNKKSITFIVSMVMFLVVVIIAIAYLNGWFVNQRNDKLSFIKQHFLNTEKIEIRGVIVDNLIIYSKYQEEIKIHDVFIEETQCNFNSLGRTNLSKGNNILNITSCLQKEGRGLRKISIVTQEGTFQKVLDIDKDMPCSIDGIVIENGDSVDLFSRKYVLEGQDCNLYKQTQTCDSGKFIGDTGFLYKSCQIKIPDFNFETKFFTNAQQFITSNKKIPFQFNAEIFINISGDGNPVIRVNNGEWKKNATISGGDIVQLGLTSQAYAVDLETSICYPGRCFNWSVKSTPIEVLCMFEDELTKKGCYKLFLDGGCGSDTIFKKVEELCYRKTVNPTNLVSWDDAKNNYCKGNYNGYDDWRLPTWQEVLTIIDLGVQGNKLIRKDQYNQKLFNIETDFWTLTTNQNNISQARVYDISQGNYYNDDKSNLHAVLCVRNKIEAQTNITDFVPWSNFFLPKEEITNYNVQIPTNIYQINQIKIAGGFTKVPIKSIGGEFRLNGGEWKNESFVKNNDTVELRIKSSQNYLTSSKMNLLYGYENIKVVNATWEVWTHKEPNLCKIKPFQDTIIWKGKLGCEFFKNNYSGCAGPNEGFYLETLETCVDTQVQEARNFQSAKNYCQNYNKAGFSDWYLPSFNQLLEIVDFNTQGNYKIFGGEEFFKNLNNLWTISIDKSNTSNVKVLDVQNGNWIKGSKLNSFNFVCVRDNNDINVVIEDKIPDHFALGKDFFQVEPDSYIISEPIVISGITNTYINSSKGEFRINNGYWQTEGIIDNGDILQLRIFSPSTLKTYKKMDIEIGNRYNDWGVWTRPSIIDCMFTDYLGDGIFGCGFMFEDNGCGEGTLKHKELGLCFEKSFTSDHTYESAISYCAGVHLGGHGDWYLPTFQEIYSLVDIGNEQTKVFKKFTNIGNAWTSTKTGENHAKVLDVSSASWLNSSITNSHSVVCVRNDIDSINVIDQSPYFDPGNDVISLGLYNNYFTRYYTPVDFDFADITNIENAQYNINANSWGISSQRLYPEDVLGIRNKIDSWAGFDSINIKTGSLNYGFKIERRSLDGGLFENVSMVGFSGDAFLRLNKIGNNYYNNGIYDSAIRDFEITRTYNNIDFFGNLPQGTDISFKVCAGDTQDGQGNTWQCSDDVDRGSQIDVEGRYCRVFVNLKTSNIALSPEIQNILIEYN